MWEVVEGKDEKFHLKDSKTGEFLSSETSERPFWWGSAWAAEIAAVRLNRGLGLPDHSTVKGVVDNRHRNWRKRG